MKTIVKNADGQSKYLLQDSDVVEMLSTSIVLADLVVSDLNASNATLHENVTPPEDWFGCKYLFDGTTWTLNLNWVDPSADTQPE